VRAVTAALAAPFPARDIKFKPQVVQGGRALAMAYTDARAVQDRLDEVLGIEGWQDHYEVLPDGSVVCRLRCKLAGEWVTKMDVGSPSEQPDTHDRVKAAFSDALKRAAVKFGVGRYLYRLPAQWVDYDPVKKQFRTPPRLPGPAALRLAPARALPAAAEPAGPMAPADLLHLLHALIHAKSRAKSWRACLAWHQIAVPEGFVEPASDEQVLALGEWLTRAQAERVREGFSQAATNRAARVLKTVPPADGRELLHRLADYEAKLVEEGLCHAGELLLAIREAGAGHGLGEEIVQWGRPGIDLAAREARRFEAQARQRAAPAAAAAPPVGDACEDPPPTS
jgi:hypothetical protein